MQRSYQASECLVHFCTVHVIETQLCFISSWNSRIAAYMRRIWQVVSKFRVQYQVHESSVELLLHVPDSLRAELRVEVFSPSLCRLSVHSLLRFV